MSIFKRGWNHLREIVRGRPGLLRSGSPVSYRVPFREVLKTIAKEQKLNQPPSVTVMPTIPFTDVLAAYFADPACKAATHELAFSAVGKGYYHSVDPDYEKADDVEKLVDDFNERANLDALLVVAAVHIAGFGNNFWLIGDPDRNTLLDVESPIKPIPVTAIESIQYQFIRKDIKVIDKPKAYKLSSIFGGAKLNPKRVVHFRWNPIALGAFGYGIIHSLLEEGRFDGETRQCYLEMKWRIEQRFIDILDKFVGPDELWLFPNISEEKLIQFETMIKKKPKAGARFIYDHADADVKAIQIDPRTRFAYSVNHIMNQNYLGLETPLAKALTTPGFTEASIRGAIELHEPVIFTMQRFIKREVEYLWRIIIEEAGYDPIKAHCRLNWGMPETPELVVADIIKAAELGLIRPEEFRKMMVKVGWELQEREEAAY